MNRAPQEFLIFFQNPKSSLPDQVLKALADQAKKAADQCTGQRPAVIALQFSDRIDTAGLEVLLKSPSGLHAIAGEVFRRLEPVAC